MQNRERAKNRKCDETKMRYGERLAVLKKILSMIPAEQASDTEFVKLNKDVTALSQHIAIVDLIVYARYEDIAFGSPRIKAEETLAVLNWRAKLSDVEDQVCNLLERLTGVNIRAQLDAIYQHNMTLQDFNNIFNSAPTVLTPKYS